MRRFGHFDHVELTSTPRQRVRECLDALFELFGLGALGWTFGTTIVELLSGRAFILRLLVLGFGSAMLVMWIRWKSWPRDLYGIGIAIVILTIAAPLVKHFLP
jgi:hypothetical protein